jgi:2'-5' RNA ligase
MNQRLFAALDLPPAVREALAEVTAYLRDQLPRNGVRWVRPAGIHLTLRFYGDVTNEQAPHLQTSLAKAARGVAPIALELSGLGVFPNAVAPRVVWVGIAGDLEPLQKIQTALEADARALGFTPETRPFTPHLTLGRVNQLRAPEKQRLSQLLKETPVKSPGRFTLDRLSLIKSDLKPAGAVYTPLFTATLAGETHPQPNV